MAFIFIRLPTGFLPDEDQGVIITQITLPSGAVQQRTLAIAKQVTKFFNETEK
jgi:multidrug efflux pump subunit AcrB